MLAFRPFVKVLWSCHAFFVPSHHMRLRNKPKVHSGNYLFLVFFMVRSWDFFWVSRIFKYWTDLYLVGSFGLLYYFKLPSAAGTSNGASFSQRCCTIKLQHYTLNINWGKNISLRLIHHRPGMLNGLRDFSKSPAYLKMYTATHRDFLLIPRNT